VELGADTILVTAMERSSHLRSPLTRLVAKAEAAMVQSGRAWMPRVDVCSSISEALVRMDGYNILVGDAQGSQPQPDDVVGPVAVVVGPEGGLTAYEIEQLVQRRCTSWRIGQARLRAETAAIAMLATVAALR
jgi:16S rRNA (uracil1498-N3)-methyltransferase